MFELLKVKAYLCMICGKNYDVAAGRIRIRWTGRSIGKIYKERNSENWWFMIYNYLQKWFLSVSPKSFKVLCETFHYNNFNFQVCTYLLCCCCWIKRFDGARDQVHCGNLPQCSVILQKKCQANCSYILLLLSFVREMLWNSI